MGAYTNPAMIIDKSGEILAAGILQGTQALTQGINAYSAQIGKAEQDAIQDRRERAEKIRVTNNKALIDGAAQQATYNQTIATTVKDINKENGVVAGIMTKEVYGDIESKKVKIAQAYSNSNNPSLDPETISGALKEVEQYEKSGVGGLAYAGNVGLWQKDGEAYISNPTKYTTYGSGGVDGVDADQARNMAMAFSIDLTEGRISKDVSFKKVPNYQTGMMTVEFYKDGTKTFSTDLDMSADDALDTFFGENYDFTPIIEEANKVNTNKDGGLKSTFYKERVQYTENDKIITRDVYNLDQIKTAYGPAIETMVNSLTNFGSEQTGKEYRKTEAWLKNIGVESEEIKAIMEASDPKVEIKNKVTEYVLNQLSNNRFEYRDGQFFTQSEANIGGDSKLTTSQKTAQLFRRGWKRSLADISAYNRKFVARPVNANGVLVTDDASNIVGYTLYGEKQRDGNITLEPVYSSNKIFTNVEELLQVIGNPEADIFAGINVE